MNLAELSFIIMLAVMAAFYIIFIRPARQEQTRLEDTIRDLREGDEVETTSGFLGVIKKIETPESGPVNITIDFGNGIEIRALTTSVARRLSSAEEREQQNEESDLEPSEESRSKDGRPATNAARRVSRAEDREQLNGEPDLEREEETRSTGARPPTNV